VGHCDPSAFTSSFAAIQSKKISTGSGEQVDQKFYIKHPIATGQGLICAAATTKGCSHSKEVYKLLKEWCLVPNTGLLTL